MNVPLSLSLWFALLVSTCSGNVGSHEEDEVTPDYEFWTVTATPDYDYNATFEYYYVTGPYEVRNKASGIGQLSLVLLLGSAVHQIWN